MNFALLTIILTLLWAAITGSFTGANLLLGAVLAMSVLWLARERFGAPGGLRRIWPVLRLAGLFLRELLLSALQVAVLVLTPGLRARLRPAILGVPLTLRTDMQITLLANMITLTPGTLSVDVSDDRSVLYVHVLMLKDAASLKADIATGFERAIKAAFA